MTNHTDAIDVSYALNAALMSLKSRRTTQDDVRNEAIRVMRALHTHTTQKTCVYSTQCLLRSQHTTWTHRAFLLRNVN